MNHTEAAQYIKATLTAFGPGEAISMTKETWAKIHEAMQALAQPERHELQADGKHPAPCARFCEANAFQIEIRNLKARLAQPEQEHVATSDTSEKRVDEMAKQLHEPEPVIDKSAAIRIATSLGWTPQRTWVGLTDEELHGVIRAGEYDSMEEFARAIEAKLKKKNT